MATITRPFGFVGTLPDFSQVELRMLARLGTRGDLGVISVLSQKNPRSAPAPESLSEAVTQQMRGRHEARRDTRLAAGARLEVELGQLIHRASWS